MKTTHQHIDFCWTIRDLYHTLFCGLLVILLILLAIIGFIAYGGVGWNEVLTGLDNRYNFSLLGACLLFFLLDRFCANKRIIYFVNNTLYYAKEKKGIVYEFPVDQIRRLRIRRIDRNNYALFVLMSEGEFRIKLTWAWVWNVWKLEKRIKQIRDHYHITEY